MSKDQTLVRPARQSDAEQMARVHLASREYSYAPLAREWPSQDLASCTQNWVTQLAVAERTNFVATISDVVVGFIGGGPARRNDVPAELQIYVVHVLPAYRCTGIGSALWDLACTTLRGSAHAPLYLDTFAELPCCAFYEARGGEVLTRTLGTFHGNSVTELVYLWPAGKPHKRRR
jgi:ribosomal protein S18 acetylase RimI-like enzyme